MSDSIQRTFVATTNSKSSIDDGGFQQNSSHLIVGKGNYPVIKIPFPPIIEPKDLIINKKSPLDNPDIKPLRSPNAFIIYRKELVKAARDQGYILPMTLISSIASASWDQETIHVKEEYKRIAKEAHKLVKEMYPKKSRQRKRKEKWNLVSFQNDLSGDKSEKMKNSTQSSTTTNAQNSSSLSPLTPISPTTNSTRSSPNLSDFDDSFIETSPIQQSTPPQTMTNSNDKVQIFDDFFIDEFYNTDLPNSFQNYLNQPMNDNYMNNNYSETFSDFPLDELFDISSPVPINDLKECVINNNNFQSSLNMTLSDAFGIINSEDFDFGFEL